VTKPSDPAIERFDADYRDSDQLGEIYNRGHARYLRSATGLFHSQMRRATLGELTFHANHHESPLMIEGVNASNLVAIGFQGPDSVPRRVVGEQFTSADVFLLGPRMEHLANVQPGQQAFQLFIPADWLENELAARLNRDPIPLTNHRYFLRLGKQGVGKLIGIVEQSFQTAQELIATSPSEAALEQMQKAILERVVSILTEGEHDLFQEGPSFTSTEWVLLQTHAYFEQSEHHPIRLADVCRAVGVSQRTLQVAFSEGLGVSPMRYLKLRRLHGVRKRLQETSANEIAVGKAAREAGFVDLSRFSRDYQTLFGQLPSETSRA
jgi:AraC family ethanolamine operon transcriptional activator